MTRLIRNTAAMQCEGARFDPADPGPFAALAGDHLVRLEDGSAVVRTGDGREMSVYPGWWVRAAPGGIVRFMAPDLVGDGPGCDWTVAP